MERPDRHSAELAAHPSPSAARPGAPSGALFDQAALELPIDEARERFESAFWRAYLQRALARSGGSVSGAARLVGTNRRYIQRLMRRYDLSSDEASD